MFHWFGVVQNTRGDVLPGWQVGVVELTSQTVVPIFSDESGTPIVSVSGVANRALADENGNYDFFIPSGTYSLNFYNSAGVFQRSLRYLPMYGEDFATDSANMDFTQTDAGATTRTAQAKLRDTVSVKDFGAVGDGVANDTAAAAAADAISGKVYLPAGTYDTTTAATALRGPFFGDGQIRDVANNKRGPYFSAVAAAPASFGTQTSVETAFNGDLSGNQFAIEHRVTGAATLGQPTSGYLYRPEAMPVYGYLYNESGWNNSTSGNGGRTGVAFQRVMVYQAGQGDAVCYNASAFVTGAKAGATDFLANPAACLFNGDIEAGAAGTYLNPHEVQLRDGGFDVAGIGFVANIYRTNATGALGTFWAGARYQSFGSQAGNQVIGVSGKWNAGLDFAMSGVDFGTNQAAVSLKAGQRIYFNNASSNDRYSTTFNGDYIEYSSGNSAINFVAGGNSALRVGATQVLVNQRLAFTLGIVLNYADDAAAAAGGLAIGDVYRTGSALKVRVA
jgi:hypothetical protein